MGDSVDPFSVSGLRVWVTGASRGLGRSFAEGLLARGASVAVTARSAEDLERQFGGSAPASGEVLLVPGSVADPLAVEGIAAHIAEEWGGLNALVNCAGVSPSLTRSERIPEDAWRHIIDINLTGSFLCAQAAAAMMLPAGSGSIINVSSIHGVAGMPRLAAYSASKGGVDALTRTLALEWADRGVRVNALSPGYFKTDMTQAVRDHEGWNARLMERIPLGRFGEPDELVPAVIFLASAASRYMTGSTLVIDGGWTSA